MDDDLDGIFSADLGEEEYEKNLPEEAAGTSQNHDPFFDNEVKPEEEGQKENRCMSYIKAIWATRNRKIYMDRETIIRTTVRELVIYLAFITIILIIALLPTFYLQTHFFTDIAQQFIFPLNSSSEKAFAKIDNYEAMTNYIQSGFLMALYSKSGENRLVGRPRIRQQRVRQIDCSLPSSVPEILKKCFPNFNPEYESREPITPDPSTTIALSADAWHWRSDRESRSEGVAGTMAYYTGSGYYLDLALTRNETYDMLIELFNGKWMAESTRAIIIDFTLYNANLNFFCVSQLLFETPYTGGVITSAQMRPLRLLRQNSPTECAIFICEIISLIFVAYYIFREIYAIYKMGLSYFRHFWHLIDFLVISLCIACVSLSIYNQINLRTLHKKGIEPGGIYPEFNHIAHMSLQYNRFLALLVFFSSIQIFKFFSYSETMGQLTATINYALYDMIGFTIMFGIVFAAFVQAGTIMFGSTSSEFKSFDLTAFALYRIILGDFDMDAIYAAHVVLGPLYFIIYIFFVFFVLLNMFLAIIGEAYAKVKENMAKRKNDFKFILFVKYNTKELFARFSKKRRMPLDKVLQSAGVGDQMELTFANWRRAMKSAGYSEMEAAFLFQKYDRDGDNILDFLERRRMREDLALGLAFQPQDSDDEEKTEDNEKYKLDSNKDVFADREDCEELNERIVQIEECINNIVRQICAVLSNMERTERTRRENEHALMKSIL